MFSPLAHDDPEQLGAYHLVARLGSGGMGTVYLGRSDTGRVAAVKTMHARTAADPVLHTRFRLETDAARVIGGHHGARVFDADAVHETPWLATEYVIGPPLDDAVRLGGPLPERAVRALGSRLCEALGRLHESEVVHRDLKPSNIMLTADGPKVIDFGIARAIGDDRLTRAGAAAGTPAFMSPEQATGGEHTSAGDVFALAGVLVFASTGRGPFGAGQAADLLYRVRYAEPDLTGVPAGLVQVLRPCFDKDPRQRPTTAWLRSQLDDGEGDFARCLPEPVLTDIARRATAVWRVEPRRLPPPPGRGLPGTVPDSTPARPSRRRLLSIGAGTALGVAAAGAGAWAWLGHDDGGTSARPGPTRSAKPAWDLRWQVVADYGDPPLLPPTPLLLDGLVAVGAYDVKGLDPRNGKTLWPDSGPWFGRRTATDGKRIHTLDYAADAAAPLTVCPVGLADGKVGDPLLEREDLNGDLYGTHLLCATDTVVYAVGGKGPQWREANTAFRKDQAWHLLALDIRARRTLWDVPLPARPDGSERLHFLSAQVSGERLVLVQQSADGATELVVRSTRTGRLLWSRPLDSRQPAFSRAHLAVDDLHVYPSAGRLLALGLDDGKVAWQYDKGGAGAEYSPPAVRDGVVYAVQAGHGVLAVDARSGEPRWAEKTGGATTADLAAPPVVGIAYVYRTASSRLAAVDLADGATTHLVRASASARYFAHEPSRRLIAVGEQYAAGYPLL
ncbi:protein kinase [Streptomyces sp. Ag109_G2-15]|uniref:serine/threonine-protein kinase n=1 Tax=Streptomyces sp. Ag109_G2-15 TaxID=1938850 RepID=UPI000BDDAE12|nr:serine/threonine-protein kinase [Streptomyces sp. Ag109_G2-15]SOD84444.1 Serine/threonine protein kinase [Streptomyces sp. Ag109_G2-15]